MKDKGIVVRFIYTAKSKQLFFYNNRRIIANRCRSQVQAIWTVLLKVWTSHDTSLYFEWNKVQPDLSRGVANIYKWWCSLVIVWSCLLMNNFHFHTIWPAWECSGCFRRPRVLFSNDQTYKMVIMISCVHAFKYNYNVLWKLVLLLFMCFFLTLKASVVMTLLL